MIKLILYFDGVEVDDIYVETTEEALELFENHPLHFEDQNEELQRWWDENYPLGKEPVVELKYAEPLKDKYCPFCGKPLYPADVRGYDYTCYDCDYFKDDTNFYSCEVD